MTPVENWNRAYREAPEIFDAFTQAEDPHGLVSRSLLSHAGLAGRSVLEVGSGTGRYTRELAPRASLYIALERSPQMLALALQRLGTTAPRLRFLCARAERIPLATASVERVIAAWVVGNLRTETRATVLQQIDRVLDRRSGGELWLLENHWTGDFQRLRGRQGAVERARIEHLIEDAGFRLVESVETELRFPSEAEAERVLGYLCGDAVRARLRRRPASRLSHNVVILRRGCRS